MATQNLEEQLTPAQCSRQISERFRATLLQRANADSRTMFRLLSESHERVSTQITSYYKRHGSAARLPRNLVNIRRNIRKEINRIRPQIEGSIVNGIQGSIDSGIQMAEAQIRNAIPANLHGQIPNLALSPAQFGTVNRDAMDFMVRYSENGLNLSQRVWKTTRAMERQIGQTIAQGFSNAMTPSQIARQLRDGFMLRPGARGRGVYRNAWDNAYRLQRTEYSRAQNFAFDASNREKDYVSAYRVSLSSAHEKIDQCDQYASEDAFGLGPGVYPASEIAGFSPPYHSHCMCGMEAVTDLQMAMFGEPDPKFQPTDRYGLSGNSEGLRDRIQSNWDARYNRIRRQARANGVPIRSMLSPRHIGGNTYPSLTGMSTPELRRYRSATRLQPWQTGVNIPARVQRDISASVMGNTQADAWGGQYMEGWEAQQDSAVNASLQDYKQAGFTPVNRSLRDPGWEYASYSQDNIRNIDRALDNAPRLSSDVKVFRGAHSPELFSQLENSAGTTIRDRAYLSTTTDADGIIQFAGRRAGASVQMEITAPRGTRALWMDSWTERAGQTAERELLFNRNSAIRIDRVIRQEDNTLRVFGTLIDG